MADDNGNGKAQRVTVAILGERLKGYSENVDRALSDAKEDRAAIIDLGTRVTVLETNQEELRRVARSDKVLERIGIAATAIAAYFGIRT